MTINGRRAALYFRVSTEEQASDDKSSIPIQRQKCELYCQLKGLEVVATFEDPGFTGTEEHRPGLDALMAAAETGAFDRVVVKHMDRFGRKAAVIMTVAERLKE